MIRLYVVFALAVFSAAPVSASTTSVSSGVAPLSVHFSAGLEGSAPGNMPFHDYEYAWDFGDTGGGNWGTNGRSKNTDKGPVAAHVYESAGTYTATLTVRNGSGVIDTETFTITVTDPDTVYADTKTTCISTGTDFAGCPDGATQVTTSNLTVLPGYADAGERILLRRGDSWTINDPIVFNNNAGPVHFGAFGACATPDALGICANAPVINATLGRVMSLSWKQDWRIVDLSIVSANTERSAIDGGPDLKNNLILRLKSQGFRRFLDTGASRFNDTDYADGNAVVSSKITGPYYEALYTGGERMALLGNIFQNTVYSHIVRIWGGYQGVVAHNILSGSPAGQHALKFHGPAPQGRPGSSHVGTYAETGNNGQRNFSKFVVIANNIFGASTPWTVAVGPQNGDYDERVSDVLFEKNRIIADYNNTSSSLVSAAAMFWGRYITVRNNIIDGTGSASGFTGIKVERRGIEWDMPAGQADGCLENYVYNNTIYNPTSTSSAYAVSVAPLGVTDVFVKNNYSVATHVSTDIFYDPNEVATMAANASDTTSYFADATNLNPLARDFSLTVAAESAIGQGATVPIYDDFLGRPRYGAMDIGAFRATPRRLFRNVRLADPVE